MGDRGEIKAVPVGGVFSDGGQRVVPVPLGNDDGISAPGRMGRSAEHGTGGRGNEHLHCYSETVASIRTTGQTNIMTGI